jgi:hypothetical protein
MPYGGDLLAARLDDLRRSAADRANADGRSVPDRYGLAEAGAHRCFDYLPWHRVVTGFPGVRLEILVDTRDPDERPAIDAHPCTTAALSSRSSSPPGVAAVIRPVKNRLGLVVDDTRDSAHQPRRHSPTIIVPASALTARPLMYGRTPPSPWRAHHSPKARTYLARRVAEGKTKREAIRVLKRFIVRAVWRAWLECTAKKSEALIEYVAQPSLT